MAKSPTEPTSSVADPHARGVPLDDLPRPNDGNRWALVVGISAYRDKRLNLQFAHRDAQSFAQLIQSDAGGGFSSDKVRLLLDDKATAAAMQSALRSFLKKPARDDLVVIFLACHGKPDHDRPDNFYVLPYDTDLDDVAGTAVPMREIDLCLRETLQASKVVILADTCHSGAIGGGIGTPRSGPRTAAHEYLERLGSAKDGVALLTSAEANQVALEDARWGGGHGVFTHHLLEGMRGAADTTGDGIVTVGELFEFVRDAVKESTDHSQHPAIGTSAFDRTMPISAPGTGAISIAPDQARIDVPEVAGAGRGVEDPASSDAGPDGKAALTDLGRGLLDRVARALPAPFRRDPASPPSAHDAAATEVFEATRDDKDGGTTKVFEATRDATLGD